MAETSKYLHSRFIDNDGILIWKNVSNDFPRANYFNSRFGGKEAGDVKSNGYKYVGLNGKRYLVHHIVYAMHHGEWPSEQIDHIDGNRINNKIENLRIAPQSINAKNQKLRENNKTGCMGVSLLPGGSWRVRIGSKHIGCFKDFELAEMVYHETKLKMGYSEDHGVRN